jgi:hypothetical protein
VEQIQKQSWQAFSVSICTYEHVQETGYEQQRVFEQSPLRKELQKEISLVEDGI